MPPFRSRAVAAAALLLLLGACAPASDGASAGGTSAAATSSDSGAATCSKETLATTKPGTLTIGTDKPAYAPWFVDDDPTSGKGFESAVAYAVADQLGFAENEVTWIVASFNSVIAPGPKSFDIDINEVSITDERRTAVDFSSGYYDVTQAIVALDSSTIAGATSIADLKGAKLGAQVGTTSLKTITDVVKPSSDPAVYNDNDTAKAALANGQIDGLVVDLPTALYMTSAELDNAKIVGQFPQAGGSPEQFGLVLDKGSALTPCVSRAVDALRSDGTLDALEKQWLTTEAGAPVLQ